MDHESDRRLFDQRGEVIPDPTESRAVKLKERLAHLLSGSHRFDKECVKEVAELSFQLGEVGSGEWTDLRDAELRVRLEEYRTLREESLNTITTRARILLLGLAAIGALIAGTMRIDAPEENSLFITMIFSVFVPLIAAITLLIWAGEAMRMKRANDYLAIEVERKINRLFGRHVLGWESALRVGILDRDERTGPSAVVSFLLLIVQLVAPLIGLWWSRTPFEWYGTTVPLWEIWIPWGLSGITLTYFWVHRHRLLNYPDGKPPFDRKSEGEVDAPATEVGTDETG